MKTRKAILSALAEKRFVPGVETESRPVPAASLAKHPASAVFVVPIANILETDAHAPRWSRIQPRSLMKSRGRFQQRKGVRVALKDG